MWNRISRGFIIVVSFLVLLSSFNLEAQEKIQFSSTVFFETDEYRLNASASAALDDLVDEMNQISEYELLIEAHTDERGDETYNEQLAKSRAESVKDYLYERGIESDVLTVNAFGESRPAKSNEDENGRAYNRRVDVSVKGTVWNSMASLKDAYHKSLKQSFVVDASKDNLIIGKHGTKVWIEKGDLQYEDGTFPKGEIEIELKECFRFEDMIAANLSTTCGNEILQTGGMIEVKATAEGKPLQVADDSSVEIGTPTADFDPEMEIFYGESDSNAELVNWAQSGQKVSNSRRALLRIAPMPTRPYYNRPKYNGHRVDVKVPTKPVPPQKPRIRSYQPPNEVDMKVQSNWFEKAFLKKRLAEKQTTQTQRAYRVYESNLKRQEYEKEAYAKAYQKYQKDSSEYTQRLAEWSAECKRVQEEYKHTEEYQQWKSMLDKIEKEQEEKYEKVVAEWRKYQAEKLANFEKEYEENGAASQNDLNRYFFKTNQLGWINCDRFYKQEAKEQLAILDENPSKDANVFLVFSEINSVLKPSVLNDGSYIGRNLPEGEKVKVVSIKVEQGKALFAAHDVVLGEDDKVDLEYQPLKIKDLKSIL